MHDVELSPVTRRIVERHETDELERLYPRKPEPAPPRFALTRRAGVETLWIRGAGGPRMIAGIASTPAVNGHKCSLSSSGCRVRLPVPLYSQHATSAPPVGQVVFVRKSAAGIYVRAVIGSGAAADHAWQLIMRGEARAFSAAAADGAHVSGIVDGVNYFDDWRLAEVSICRAGANPDARLEVFIGRIGDDD